MHNKDRNKIFIEACKKAGLAVQKNASSQIKKGIIICDAKGEKYTVDSNGKLKRITPAIRVTPAIIDPKAVVAIDPNKFAMNNSDIKLARFSTPRRSQRKSIFRMVSHKKGKFRFQND